MAAPPLVPLPLNLQHHTLVFSFTLFPRRRLPPSPAAANLLPIAVKAASQYRAKDGGSYYERIDYRSWKDKEEEIRKDILPITLLAKHIIHSSRYMDGERLTLKDEKIVVEKLLAYHPHAEDKIGCGIDSIMVDQHPLFRQSRCLFVLRTDGMWIDFSYQKCIRAYIRHKYPSHAERFIREHYKRGCS